MVVFGNNTAGDISQFSKIPRRDAKLCDYLLLIEAETNSHSLVPSVDSIKSLYIHSHVYRYNTYNVRTHLPLEHVYR